LKKLNYGLKVSSVLFLACNVAFGWGRTGHQIINGNFGKFLPMSLQSLSEKSSYYVQHASDADSRKSADPSESPKHFIDIDAYPDFAAGTLTHDYDSLLAKYGSTTVIRNGTLPWAISSTYNSLVVYLENGDHEKADSVIADLGHYIGDAFQPLHCTENYDGKLTGNGGIHSRFETGLLDRYQGSVTIDPVVTDRIDTTALEFAFRVIGESNALVGDILDADTYAKTVDPQYGTAYYAAMWARLDTMMNERLQSASEALASLVYSAWLDAGSPSLTTGIPALVPSTFSVSEIYPNPFNPAAKFNVTLSQSSRPSVAVVSIYSPDGRMVKSDRRNLAPGSNVVALDLTRYSSGVYFVVVDVDGSPRHERKTLKAVLLK
jgi:hypothetical protein